MKGVRAHVIVVALCAALNLSLNSVTQAQPGTAPRREQARQIVERLRDAQQRLASIRKQNAEWKLAVAGDDQPGSADAPQSSAGQDDEMSVRLRQIEQKLDEIQRAIADIQSWIEGQTETLMTMSSDINRLKRVRAGNYVQFQYRDTNQPGGSPDAFSFRRIRISQTNIIDARTSMKLGFDVAVGTDNLQAQLRDAQLIYDIEPSEVGAGVQLLLGQQPLPLGYELGRSSSEREFPERTYANRLMFNGERGRGLYVRYEINPRLFVHTGIWNSLTYNDPEQRGKPSGVGNRLAVSGGVRYHTPSVDVGLSALAGRRPSYTAGGQTSPEVERTFIFLDGTYIGLIDPNLFVRGELMFGKDRVPSTTASPTSTATEMLSWHVVLAYNLSARNQLALRYEQFDPDRTTTGSSVHGYGVAYIYYINPGARLTAAYEVVFDTSQTPNRYHITTLRLQYRM